MAPAIAGLLARVQIGTKDVAPALPVVTAFFSLFVPPVIALLGYAADHGFLAGLGVNTIAEIVPRARDLNVDSVGNTLAFGALLGFLAAIFAGSLCGVLAPRTRS